MGRAPENAIRICAPLTTIFPRGRWSRRHVPRGKPSDAMSMSFSSDGAGKPDFPLEPGWLERPRASALIAMGIAAATRHGAARPAAVRRTLLVRFIGEGNRD